MYRDQITAFTTVFEQNRFFFGLRIPWLYAQLGALVHRCRQLQCLGKRAQARQLLDEELFKLFGVRAECSDDRPLSVLAGVMRHVLISGVRLQQPATTAQGSNTTLLVLDDQLHHLSRWLPEHVSLLEMRYFARVSLGDTACELGVAADVVKRELRFARASLTRTCGLARLRESSGA